MTVGPEKSTYREGNATVRSSVVQEGQLQLVDLGDNHTVLHPEDRVLSATNPGRKLAEDGSDGKVDAGKLVLTNASPNGNTLDGLRKSGKLTVPIHMRKRGRKARRGT